MDLMVNKSHLERIELAIIQAINTMTVANGYNYDWESVNQEDLNKVSSFPHINIYLDDEEDFDEDAYCKTQFRATDTWRFECFNKIEDEESDSMWTSYYYQESMIADIKKLTGDNKNLGLLVGNFIYVSSEFEDYGQGEDIFIPLKLIVKVKTDYIENRNAI